MNRRDFMTATGFGMGAAWPGLKLLAASVKGIAGTVGTAVDDSPQTASERSNRAERTYHVLGVPLRAGSLYPGNENDAQPYRDVQLVARLQAAGCKAVDDGDVEIPSYLPHHSVPPIRNWPGPRIAWECVGKRVAPYLKQPGQIPLLVGCDCSVVIGTTQALRQASGEQVHVLYIDGDFDDAAPDPEHCQSAASMDVWLLTHQSPFWVGPPLPPSQVTVIGWSNPSKSDPAKMGSVPLAELRRSGAQEAVRRAMAAIPTSAAILAHFDVDVFQKQEMPSAYFPHPEGLTLSEGRELLGILLKDPRIRIIEVSEYAALRDLDQRWVGKIVDLLVAALKN